MCDPDLGCQLKTPYFGFRIGASMTPLFTIGEYGLDHPFNGNFSGGFDAALTLRHARSDSPQDGSFEGFGYNLGYTGEWTIKDSYKHMGYFSFEFWTYDGQLTPYLGLGGTAEQFYNSDDIRGGARLLIGTQWRPFTYPMQMDRVNPYIGGQVFLGGEGGDGQGGFVIGLNISAGIDFFPLF